MLNSSSFEFAYPDFRRPACPRAVHSQSAEDRHPYLGSVQDPEDRAFLGDIASLDRDFAALWQAGQQEYGRNELERRAGRS